jgi:hypothetical protein
VRNEVIHRKKEERNILPTIKRKAYWIGHIFRRNCFVKYVIEGKTGKNISDGNTRKNSKQLLDDLKEVRGYWKLKEEKPRVHRTVRRTRFGKGYGPVI